MLSKLINWDVYEVIAESSPLEGVKFRGRVRKFCLEAGRNILIENAEDMKNRVRFAIPSGENVSKIIEYIIRVVPDAKVVKIMDKVQNPVISKLKVNSLERYKGL